MVLKLNLLIDTDIGGEVSDAMALTLAIASRKVEVVGVTTVTGDTESNIAEALDKNPTIISKVKKLILMGGMINPVKKGFLNGNCQTSTQDL